jgi:hypothetical protein
MAKGVMFAMAALAIVAGCARKQAAETAAGPASEIARHVEAAPRQRLEEMRAQFAIVEMNPDTSFLTNEESRVVNLLNEAAGLMSDIYLRQVSEDNPQIRAAIAASRHPDRAILLDLFDLHFGPWDTVEHHRPFYGATPRPPGAAFYPEDMTKDEFETFLAANPGERAAFTSPYTVIRRDETGVLKAIPYSEYYREWLEPAAELLRRAAAISKNESLKTYLTLRADAFLSNDYFASEMAWMDLEGPIEAVIGPYEVYTDELFGYKAAFEAFVTVKNPTESAALAKYKNYLREMEANLPVAEEYKNFRRGFESPIVVAEQVQGGGDNVPGVQTIAFNLPNDERVREAKGAKKVLLSNVMAAKFDRILNPMAAFVLVPEQASLLKREYMGVETLFHELAHSLGPGTIVKDGAETTVNAELKELYSPLEEGKADVMGAYNVLYMMQKGELPIAEKENFLATYFVGLFRAMRFGINEAHGRGAAFQYAFFKERGAALVDEASGKFRLDFAKLEAAIAELTRAVVVLQGDGDYAAAKAFLDERARLDAPAQAVIDSLAAIPVDIQPVYRNRI